MANSNPQLIWLEVKRAKAITKTISCERGRNSFCNNNNYKASTSATFRETDKPA